MKNSDDKVSVLNKIITRLEIEYLELDKVLVSGKSVDDYFLHNSLLEAIKNPEIKYLSPEKHTRKKDDKRSNIILQDNEQQVQTGEERSKHVNSFRVYSELLILAMNVLQNTEESNESGFKLKLDPDEQRTKKTCFKIVVEHSIKYALVFYILCMKFLKDNESDETQKEKKREISIILFLLPLLHEEMLKDYMGSAKLMGPISNMLYDKETCMSEFQRFLSVFLYADLKGQDYLKNIKSFISTSRRSYIRDSCFFKLQQYYYDSNDAKVDKQLVELMADILVNSRKGNDPKAKVDRNRIITELSKRK